MLFQCSQSSTFRHFDVLAWHVSQFVWVQCRETVLAGAHLRWGRKRGARKMEKKILGRILEQTFKNLRTEWIGVGSVYTAICAGFRPLVVWCGAVENLFVDALSIVTGCQEGAERNPILKPFSKERSYSVVWFELQVPDTNCLDTNHQLPYHLHHESFP